ncbi:MAG: hypothetical protein GQ569_06035 [Methylococcaceae bacterium]|nr:hypothetical protein [Methylococcaceae bacterium]
MKTLNSGLLIVFTSLLLMQTGCSTSGQKPIDEKPENVLPSLTNTKWHYMDSDWEYDIEFLPDGLMRTKHPNDRTPSNDSWQQKGEKVVFFFNEKYSVYRGKFSGRNVISGTAASKGGATWKWKAVRVEQ